MTSGPQNILVFPAGTEIGLEIHNALKYSKFVRLFGATSLECHADFVFENYIEELAPFVDDPDFIPYMNRIIDKYRIDWIYPAHDSALLTLAENRELLHCPLVAPATETVQLCRDKNKTYDFFRDSWYITRYYKSVDEVTDYPVFIKPTIGQGATDARRVDDRAHLEEAFASGTEYAVCEYLPGSEYTVDCFTDRNRKLLFANFRMRDAIVSGIAVQSHPMAADEEILRIAEDINRKLEFKGSWFFQVKKNTRGEYKLLEIAPRIAGTTTVTRNLGVNLEMLTLFTLWDTDVTILKNDCRLVMNRGFDRCYRAALSYEKVYIEQSVLTDADGKPVPELMRFLYQALNQSKELILLVPADTAEQPEACAVDPALFQQILPDNIETILQSIEGIGSGIVLCEAPELRNTLRVRDIPVFDLSMLELLLTHTA